MIEPEWFEPRISIWQFYLTLLAVAVFCLCDWLTGLPIAVATLALGRAIQAAFVEPNGRGDS